MARVDGTTSLGWCRRHKISAGVNWYPIKQIVVKGEYTYGILRRQYNNEPQLAIGIAYTGWFK